MNKNAWFFCFACCATVVIPLTAMNKQTEKLMRLYATMPLEICQMIDTYVPPFTIKEHSLTAREKQHKDLPFMYKVKENNTDKMRPIASIRYYDKKGKQYRNILHQNIDRTIYSLQCEKQDGAHYRCIGPFTIAGKELCIINDGYYPILLPTERSTEFRGEKNKNGMPASFAALFGEKLRLHIGSEYFVDADGNTGTIYTARRDGAIFSYTYQEVKKKFYRRKVQPEFSQEVEDALYEAPFIKCGMVTLDATSNAIQFDHTQPDIALVRRHLFDTSYAVLHRPTGYIVYDKSPRADRNITMEQNFYLGQRFYNAQEIAAFPLLEHTSRCRLRLLGENIKTKTVKISLAPEQQSTRYIREEALSCLKLQSDLLQPKIIRILRAAQKFYKRLEKEKKNGCALERGQDIIARFKQQVPNPSDRYFFVWYSAGVLTKLHEWLQQQKIIQNITKL